MRCCKSSADRRRTPRSSVYARRAQSTSTRACQEPCRGRKTNSMCLRVSLARHPERRPPLDWGEPLRHGMEALLTYQEASDTTVHPLSTGRMRHPSPHRTPAHTQHARTRQPGRVRLMSTLDHSQPSGIDPFSKSRSQVQPC